MNEPVSRRNFLKQTSLLAAATAAVGLSPAGLRAANASRRLRVAVIGCNARGMAHIAALMAVPELEISHVCDVDSRAVAKGIAAVAKKQNPAPKGENDLRRLLEDQSVDAITIATPDHWHAPAAILGCAAGKHVYVEKPGSHNARESQWIVQAARKYRRQVQMGNQRRSWPWVIEAIEALKAGEIGQPLFARCWYTNHRASIGRGQRVPVPEWLDYDLWQGPAPEQPYRDNLIHYNWHWFWNWATGELGNNGVHSLDLARWGMGLDLPRRVTAGGGRYFGKDDWETPDTMVANFDFGDKFVVWEGQSCAPRGFEGAGFGCSFYGENGVLALAGNEAVFYDLKGKVLRQISGKKGLFDYDTGHFANFADGIREGKPLRSEIEDGQKSTLLCHLGNIAWRSGKTVDLDPTSGKLLHPEPAVRSLWGRAYRRGWQPKF